MIEEYPPSGPRVLKRGERIWNWSAEGPTPFEIMLAGHLSAFQDKDSPDRDNGVFRVSCYSWCGDDDLTQKIVSCIPRDMETKLPRFVTFLAIDEKMEFTVPITFLFNSSKSTCIDIRERKVTIYPSIILLVASRQIDYDGEGPALVGHDDALGTVSLIAGHVMNSVEIFNSYFCIMRRKFLCGDLQVADDPAVARTVIPLSELGGLQLDATDDKTHAALWFAGKAFSARDHASKLVFYKVALESAAGTRNIENFFKRLYKGRGDFADYMIDSIRKAKSARDDIVHRGERRWLTSKVERYIQASIVDALRARHGNSLRDFAAHALFRAEHGETHSSSD